MREILFRGQTRKKGEKVNIATRERITGNWVYGGIFPGTGDYSIIYGGETENDREKNTVYSETVGQYTGFKDKNGEKIFEGDILELDGEEEFFEVGYETNAAKFVIIGDIDMFYFDNVWTSEIEVVGNIHDNPELMGGSEK